MKTAYTGKAIFLTVIFIFSLFFFSCDNLLQSLTSGDGIGYVSLSIGGVRAGRTILPNPDIGDFKRYRLEFTKDDTPMPAIDRESFSEPIPLPVGTYSLFVTAYMDTDCEKPAAYGVWNGMINSGQNKISLTLEAVNDEGKGIFKWAITYDDGDVATAGMTITPLNGGTDEQTLYFKGGDGNNVPSNFSVTLDSGYYRVIINLSNNEGNTAELRKILHIYQNMESVLKYDFTPNHFLNVIFVTNGFDSGEGSLRQAIDQVEGKIGSTIVIDSNIKNIGLENEINISTDGDGPAFDFTIEGNGVTITKAGDSSFSFFTFYNYGPDIIVKIRRVHFSGGQNEKGGAVYNNGADITFESCIFSGNQADNGGAVYNESGIIDIKGCTFYGNRANVNSAGGGFGGAIFIINGYVNITGNLFYANNPVISNSGGSINSLGCNVVDVKFIPVGPETDDTASNGNCGWIKNNDKYITNPIVMHETYQLLNSRNDVPVGSIIDYPTIDFYGYPVTGYAAAGAVQKLATETPRFVKFNSMGEIIGSFAVRDGFYIEGLTPKSAYDFKGWYKDENYLTPMNFSNKITQDLLLYAKWTYTVIFYANGGNGDMPTQTFTCGKEQKLSKMSFTNPGMTFVGWASLSDGPVEYDDEQIVNLTTSAVYTGKVNLYAVWYEENNVFDVENSEKWNEALNYIIENAAPGDKFIINVKDSFSVTSSSFGDIINIEIIIKGNNTLTLSGTGSLLKIIANQTVIIENLKLQGKSDNDSPLVVVDGDNVKLIMQGEAKVFGNTNNGGPGNGTGGVYITNKGTLTMNGNASVSLNNAIGVSSNGGGVYVDIDSTFNMDGFAFVSDNMTNGSGGGVTVNGGTFNMYGNSSVYNNQATGSGGGVFVYNEGSNFTMNSNSSVHDNQATGTISSGGGVFVNNGSDFKMNGGSVFKNNANGYDPENPDRDYGGGGVFVLNSAFEMRDGKIYGNTARAYGGGVYVYGASTFSIYYGTIYGNVGEPNGNTASVKYAAICAGWGTNIYRKSYSGSVIELINTIGDEQKYGRDNTINIVDGEEVTP